MASQQIAMPHHYVVVMLLLLGWQFGEFSFGVEAEEYPFNPKIVPGIKLWLDASDDNSFLTQNGNVQKWANQLFLREGEVHTVHHLIPKSDKTTWRPVRGFANGDGYPGVIFDGASPGKNPDHLQTILPKSSFNSAEPFTMFVVVQPWKEGTNVVASSGQQDVFPPESGWQLVIENEKLSFQTTYKDDMQLAQVYAVQTGPLAVNMDANKESLYILAVRTVENGDNWNVELTSSSRTQTSQTTGDLPKTMLVDNKLDQDPDFVLSSRKYQNPSFGGYMGDVLLFASSLTDDDFQCILRRMRLKYGLDQSFDNSLDHLCADFVDIGAEAPDAAAACTDASHEGPMDSCCEGKSCTTWTMTKKVGTDALCNSGTCEWEVCMTLNTALPGCTKSGAISHRCDNNLASGSTSCRTSEETPWDVEWDYWTEVEGEDFATDCQQGIPGSTLYFILKDGAQCIDSASWELDVETGTQVNCKPTPDRTCNGVGAGSQCMYTITLPACDPVYPVANQPAPNPETTTSPAPPDTTPGPPETTEECPEGDCGGGGGGPEDDPNCMVEAAGQSSGLCAEKCHVRKSLSPVSRLTVLRLATCLCRCSARCSEL